MSKNSKNGDFYVVSSASAKSIRYIDIMVSNQYSTVHSDAKL